MKNEVLPTDALASGKNLSWTNGSITSREASPPANSIESAATIPHYLPVCEVYTDKIEHYVELQNLELPHQAMTWALQKLRPVRQDFAYSSQVSYDWAFNWDEITKQLREHARTLDYVWPKQTSYHVIAFYSRLKAKDKVPEGNYAELSLLDKAALEEAVVGGGLLKYWFGVPDGTLRNLATCKCRIPCVNTLRLLIGVGIWRSEEEAHKVHYGRHHAEASKKGRQNYEDFEIQEWEIVVEAGIRNLDVVFKRNVHHGRAL